MIFLPPSHPWASLVAQRVKNLPTMQETQVWYLGQEGLLEKKMAAHFSILAWRIPCTGEPGGLQSMQSQRVGHNWLTDTLTFTLSHLKWPAQNWLWFLKDKAPTLCSEFAEVVLMVAIPGQVDRERGWCLCLMKCIFSFPVWSNLSHGLHRPCNRVKPKQALMLSHLLHTQWELPHLKEDERIWFHFSG